MSLKAKAFNPFVRAKHSGITPYRSNFNLKRYKKTRRQIPKRALAFTETVIPPSDAQVVLQEARGESAQPQPSQSNCSAAQNEEPPNGPTFQRNRLTCETQRLSHLADEWAEMKDSENVPEHVTNDIDAVVGGTRLLISSKFLQFSSLIDNAKRTNGEGPNVTPEDLDGFWDMMSIQIRDLNNKYTKLEIAKRQGWPTVKPSPARTRRQRRAALRPKGVSKFRDFLLSKMRRSSGRSDHFSPQNSPRLRN